MIVFVDMDGVLTDFNGGIADLLGMTVEEMITPGTYGATAGIGWSEKQMWEAIAKDERFFEKLKPYPWVDILLRTLEGRVGEDNVCLLTAPAKGAEQGSRCVAGKVRWINKYIPRYDRKYLIGSPKYLCAKPGATLIDDSDKKINAFMKAGGNGILFPQRWNSDHVISATGDRLKTVNGRLETILMNEKQNT